MERRTKWLWIVTTANLMVAILLVLVIYATMLALSVLAPEISEGPLFVLLALGVPLSIIGLRLTRGVGLSVSRGVTLAINGCALALSILIIGGMVALFVSSTEERFLIPEGYKGDVYVIYNVPDGETVSRTRWEVTYRIPEDGILRTRAVMNRSWTRSKYYYVRKDDSLKRIRNFWCCTIDPTPENIANDTDIGVYFPRTGTFGDAFNCSMEYEQFYLGTKAHLLTKYKEKDLTSYLRNHPDACSGKSK